MYRALVLLLTLASCLSAAHAGYWRLVDTRAVSKQAPANDMFVNRVSGSSSGAVLETALPANSNHQDRGKALVSKASWSIPPDVLSSGQKHFWQVELSATRAELGAHWHLQQSITLAECRTRPGEPGAGCGGHRPITSATIHTAGSRVLNNRGSGEWIVPTGAVNQKLWLVADCYPALFRVIYTYAWAEGVAPKTTGTSAKLPGSPGTGNLGSAMPGTGGQQETAGAGAVGRVGSGTSVTYDEPRSGGSQGGTADGVAGGAEVEIFNNGNLSGVENKGMPADFTLPRAARISSILTYHYNQGRGAPGGNIRILGDDGTTYGPWKVEVKNQVYWIARPNATLPAGRYRVIDSDPATWSQNSGSGGAGHTIIKGYWSSGESPQQPPMVKPQAASRPIAPTAQPGDYPGPGVLALGGHWNCPAGTCTVRQRGEQLTFIKGGNSSSGQFSPGNRNRVMANEWAGMEGRLGAYYKGNRMAASEAKDRFGLEPSEIRWADGTVWSR